MRISERANAGLQQAVVVNSEPHGAAKSIQTSQIDPNSKENFGPN